MALKLALLLCSVALLAELSIRSDATHREHMAQVVGRNKAKMCGSVFRNAIIYSCGASRRKREEMDPPLLAFIESVEANSKKVLENVKLQSTSDPELKQPQGDGPLDKEPSWSDFYEYYNDDTKNIPMVEEDPAWNSADLENDPELKQLQRDHPPYTVPSWTDFLDLYNGEKEYIGAGAEDGGQESPDEKGSPNPAGSDFPQAKVKRKRTVQLEMAIKCCTEGCTAQDVIAAFCLK